MGRGVDLAGTGAGTGTGVRSLEMLAGSWESERELGTALKGTDVTS